MSSVDGNGFSGRSDAAVLAERLQGDRDSRKTRARDPQAELKSKIHRACIARLGAAFLNLEATNELAPRVRRLVAEQLDSEQMPLSPAERTRLERQIADDILGYGPLEPLLRDDSSILRPTCDTIRSMMRSRWASSRNDASVSSMIPPRSMKSWS